MLWKSHCQLLRRGDRVSKTPYCTRSSISSLNCTLLYASSRSTITARVCSSGILRRHRMRIWPSFHRWFFLLGVLLGLGALRFSFLSPEQTSWPQSIPSVFPWCFALWGYGIRSVCHGPFPVWGLAWGYCVTNPREPALLRSFLRTVWRARSCYLLTGS